MNLWWQQCTICLAKLKIILEGKFCFNENWHQYRLTLLNNLSPKFFPNIPRLSVVTSIDIADSFTALVSPEHNQNTHWSHIPMRGQGLVPVTNQRSDRDNLYCNHDPWRYPEDTPPTRVWIKMPAILTNSQQLVIIPDIWFRTLRWLKYSQKW